MRAVEACWRAMDRAVRNYEALGAIHGQNIAKPAQMKNRPFFGLCLPIVLLEGLGESFRGLYAGPLAT